jgi:hypothetical protein
VAVAGAIILATGGWYWLDPAVALAIALVIAYHAVALIRKVLTRRVQDRLKEPVRLGDRHGAYALVKQLLTPSPHMAWLNVRNRHRAEDRSQMLAQ